MIKGFSDHVDVRDHWLNGKRMYPVHASLKYVRGDALRRVQVACVLAGGVLGGWSPIIVVYGGGLIFHTLDSHLMQVRRRISNLIGGLAIIDGADIFVNILDGHYILGRCGSLLKGVRVRKSPEFHVHLCQVLSRWPLNERASLVRHK